MPSIAHLTSALHDDDPVRNPTIRASESAALSSSLAKPSCTTVGVTQVPRYPVKMSPMRKGLNRTNTVSREWLAGIVLMFEQLFRFLNFGEILSRIEIDEDWCEHL